MSLGGVNIAIRTHTNGLFFCAGQGAPDLLVTYQLAVIDDPTILRRDHQAFSWPLLHYDSLLVLVRVLYTGLS
jgi:hypothetical protein